MKTAFWILGALFLGSLPLACSHDLATVTAGGGGTPTPTPQTLTVSISSGSLGTYSGFYYSCTGFTNDTTTGLLSLGARVGDSIALPAVGGLHPLYFDPGSTTCIYSGVGTGQTYTFTGAGTYYFHCGFHGLSCTTTAGCGSTNCAGMAGVVVVTP